MALEDEHDDGFGSDKDLFAEEELESFSEPAVLNFGVSNCSPLTTPRLLCPSYTNIYNTTLLPR